MKHVAYGFLGAVIFAIGGYFTGLALYIIVLSSSVYLPVAANSAVSTALTSFVVGGGTLPLLFGFAGAVGGFFGGFIYSHERDSVPVKPS